MTQPPTNAQAVQQAILSALYALFLGGIITAFLVVGLTTFYPRPVAQEQQLQELSDRESAIYNCAPPKDCTITTAQQQELDDINTQREALLDQQQAAQQQWSRNAGLILIALATLLLALALVRWDRAIVLGNGLLLGGLFTMVGGIGLTIAAGEGILRFVILTIALAITVGLGYLRFARGPSPSPVAAEPGAAELAGRVAVLESRLDDVRRALGG